MNRATALFLSVMSVCVTGIAVALILTDNMNALDDLFGAVILLVVGILIFS